MHFSTIAIAALACTAAAAPSITPRQNPSDSVIEWIVRTYESATCDQGDGPTVVTWSMNAWSVDDECFPFNDSYPWDGIAGAQTPIRDEPDEPGRYVMDVYASANCAGAVVWSKAVSDLGRCTARGSVDLKAMKIRKR